jgi:hypothetical protein
VSILDEGILVISMDFDVNGVGIFALVKCSTLHGLFKDFNEVYDSVKSDVLYKFLFEFSVAMRLVSLIKMC